MALSQNDTKLLTGTSNKKLCPYRRLSPKSLIHVVRGVSLDRLGTTCYRIRYRLVGIRVVSALCRFGPGRFGLGRFGQFLGWVVSALVGGSFRPIFEVSRFGPGSFRTNFLLLPYLDEHRLLSEKQHAFRKWHSCETQLITVIDDWAKILDNQGQVDTFILDFEKAFDTPS